MRLLRPVLRKLGRRPVLLARVWELQKRGVLHVHPLLGYSTPAERAAAAFFGNWGAWRQLTASATWSANGRRWPRRPPLPTYGLLCEGQAQQVSLTETVKSADMPRSIVYVAPWLSQKSGWTMRSLRLKRYLWVQIGPDLLRLLLVHTGLGLVDLSRRSGRGKCGGLDSGRRPGARPIDRHVVGKPRWVTALAQAKKQVRDLGAAPPCALSAEQRLPD